VAGQRVLLARADRGREILRERLAEVAEVEQLTVYSQVDALEANPEIVAAIGRGEMDFITVTSSNIGRALVNVLGEEGAERLRKGAIRLVSISPVTSATLRELGLPVAAEAREYTTAGVVAALVDLVQQG
jgi:uroporphyrinogen III methyltransferase/synthase